MASPVSSTASDDPSQLRPGELDVYKLAVEMADRVSARRGTANNFFLAVHAAVITAVAALLPRTNATGLPLDSTLVALAGIALCVAWWLSLRSYRDLNTAKFAVIHEIEKRLPVAPFANEWQLLKKDKIEGWRTRYAELGQVEQFVPIVFGMLYVLSLAVAWWP